jgi:hypothetical protein
MEDRLLMMDKPLQEAFHNAVQDAFRRGYLAGVGDSSDGWSGEPCADYPPETNRYVRQAMELHLLEYEYEMEAAKHAALLEIVQENDAALRELTGKLQK